MRTSKSQAESVTGSAPSSIDGSRRQKVGNFDVCREMAKRGMDIRISPLGNITHLNYRPKLKGTDITIGIDGDLVSAIAIENKYIGGLLLINREQYFALIKELGRRYRERPPTAGSSKAAR